MRRICVVTGSRAEFGLLSLLMEELQEIPDLQLQLIATGSHLSLEQGLTVREIEAKGFHVDERVDILVSGDTAMSVTKSMSLALVGIGTAYQALTPDLVVMLGDRFEIFAAASAAWVAGIPIAHLHGGEVTEGAYDEAFRHSITKMSYLHFVATEAYRNRVIQLGEDPENVFNVGALGVDAALRVACLSKAKLTADLGFQFCERNVLVTYHPVTLEGEEESAAQLTELLAVLDQFPELGVVFTMPNVDSGHNALSRAIEEFVASCPRAKCYQSLGQARYMSLMQAVDAVVGNSSSGLIEAPALKVPTVNIGSRQNGRLLAGSVISAGTDRHSIKAALTKALSIEFRESLRLMENPYGKGGAAKRIAGHIARYTRPPSLKKRFHDLPFRTEEDLSS